MLNAKGNANRGASQSYHQVKITKGLKSKEEARAFSAFVGEHLADFQGETQQGYAVTEEHFRIPKVVFSSSDQAHSFVNEVSARFGIPRENIAVKPITKTN